MLIFPPVIIALLDFNKFAITFPLSSTKNVPLPLLKVAPVITPPSIFCPLIVSISFGKYTNIS